MHTSKNKQLKKKKNSLKSEKIQIQIAFKIMSWTHYITISDSAAQNTIIFWHEIMIEVIKDDSVRKTQSILEKLC